MKKTSLAVFVSLFVLAVAAHARGVSGETSGDVSGSVSGEIRESTDPAKIAEVEQRATEIIARQQAEEQQSTSGESGDETPRKPTKRSQAKERMDTPQDRGSGASSDSDASGAGSGMSGQDSGSPSKY